MNWRGGRCERSDMAGGVAGDRQLIGIINLDNGIRAPSSADRPSRSDPKAPVAMEVKLPLNGGDDRRKVGGQSPPIGRPCRSTCWSSSSLCAKYRPTVLPPPLLLEVRPERLVSGAARNMVVASAVVELPLVPTE